MKRLSDVRPFVGDAMKYLYDGSSNEKLRVCSVYAFHLFTDGPGEIEIDGIRYPIERGTFIFLRPGQPHAFHISPERPLSSYNLYCDLWERPGRAPYSRTIIYAPQPFHLDETAPEESCEELALLPKVYSLRAFPHLYDGFIQVVRFFDELELYRHETVNSYFYGWLLAWFNVLQTRQPTDYRIVRFLQQLHASPERRDSIAEWSRSCGLKRTYFHELFLRETGFTPKAYQHNLLMKKAANLLLESEMSVTLIAEKLGYGSIHPFSRHFSSFYGMTPSEYRKNPQALR
ncbi:AraC family transcriptional regulator [Paenibacillus yonginensis]|uniref:AraC family transcriptional regulator n=1 Tax=Paenibacillus yonginensis TaxID=1462996 RepID=A0A1B1MYR1_9BACL|nr:AraC family transcriptional regulator [Paenibacillus yonginensis]ANS74318.1 AraC family transcriptional regulator [Paenibacillus yonginensis]